MLDYAEKETRLQIEDFKEIREKIENEPKGHHSNLETTLDYHTFVDIERFLAIMALKLGLRNRVLQEYFDILVKAGKFEISHKNTKQFRATEPIIRYLASNPIMNEEVIKKNDKQNSIQ